MLQLLGFACEHPSEGHCILSERVPEAAGVVDVESTQAGRGGGEEERTIGFVLDGVGCCEHVCV